MLASPLFFFLTLPVIDYIPQKYSASTLLLKYEGTFYFHAKGAKIINKERKEGCWK